jgi:hypothetical protein
MSAEGGWCKFRLGKTISWPIESENDEKLVISGLKHIISTISLAQGRTESTSRAANSGHRPYAYFFR